ncbi:MAG: SDR family NAD(P)-dependent oxidoreductase, partial [Limisphaerales bacterium]
MNNPTLTDSGLTGATAIVTGGSRGIGRAIVQVLAAAGMDVVFTYRENAVAAAEVAAAGEGMKITGEAVDVRDSAACAALAEKVFDRTGRIDLLVNNAG